MKRLKNAMFNRIVSQVNFDGISQKLYRKIAFDAGLPTSEILRLKRYKRQINEALYSKLRCKEDRNGKVKV